MAIYVFWPGVTKSHLLFVCVNQRVVQYTLYPSDWKRMELKEPLAIVCIQTLTCAVIEWARTIQHLGPVLCKDSLLTDQ